MYDVIALGELLIDFAAKETDVDGYPTMKANPGGAPGNFLAALNKYGMKTAFLGKVGDDAFGKLLVKTFEKAGIETKGILTDPSVFTTLAFVTFSPEGDRSFSFARKPGADTRLSFEEIDLTMIDEASVFHFGTLSLTDDPVRTATKKCVEYAKEHGKLITFDPNLRLPLWETTDAAKEQILWGLAHADVVKISDEEVEFLWGITDEKEAAEKLLDEFGIHLAMVTMGPKGAYLANQNGAAYAKCPKVKPIDTTGAGDIFGGSAVSRLLKTGKAPEELGTEELGFIGTVIIIILLLFITIECILIARKAKDTAGKMICCGFAALVGFQSLVNIGVASGVLPNTGLPLPFVSYGLTSLLSLYIGVGLVLNVGLQPKKY